MSMPLVSDPEVRAAQATTLATFALWMAIGYVPGTRRHANAIRLVLLAVYLAGAAGFVAYAFFR